MKKFRSFILSFLLIIPCIFAITACGSPVELKDLIVIVNDGNLTTYEYQNFNLTEIEVKALYSDNTKKTLTSDEYSVTIDNSPTNPRVYVSYKNKKAIVALHIEKLASIEFETPSVILNSGEKIDYSALVLKAVYKDRHKENILCSEENATLSNTPVAGVQNLTYDFHGKKASIKVETLPKFVTLNKGEVLENKEPFALEKFDQFLDDTDNNYNLTELKSYYNLAVTYDNTNFITDNIVFPEIEYSQFEKGLQTIKPYYTTKNGTKIECPIKINIFDIVSFNLIQNETPIYLDSMIDVLTSFSLELTYEKWDSITNSIVKETKPCDIEKYIGNIEYNAYADKVGENSFKVLFTPINGVTPISKTISYNAVEAKINGITLLSNIPVIQYQTFDLNSIELYYTYESPEISPVYIDSSRISFSVSSVDTSKAGLVEVTATCVDEENWVEGTSKTLTFNIEVVELTSISANLCEGISISAGSEITADLFDIMANDEEYIYDYENVTVTPNVANVESGQTLEIEISYHGIKTTVSVVVQ